MSTTRPGELARIQEISKGDPYRAEVLTLLAVLNERSERQEEITKAHTAWQIEHDKKDEVRFERGDARMSAIEKSLGGAVSGVNTLQDDKAMVKGAWKALTIVATVVAVMSGAFAWLWENIRTAFGPHP